MRLTRALPQATFAKTALYIGFEEAFFVGFATQMTNCGKTSLSPDTFSRCRLPTRASVPPKRTAATHDGPCT
jgi:hypothetical protein